jgi:hypothetical protein
MTYEKLLEQSRRDWMLFNRMEKVNNSATELKLIAKHKELAKIRSFTYREIVNERYELRRTNESK